MIRKRILAGFIFGLLMMVFMFIIQYFSDDHHGNRQFMNCLKDSAISAILSGIIYGSLHGRFPKKKYD